MLVGKVPDHAPEGWRQLLDQGRRGEDFFVLRSLGVFQHIDYLELVLPRELLPADALQVGDRYLGTRTAARYVKRQQVFRQESSSMGSYGDFGVFAVDFVLSIAKNGPQLGPLVALREPSTPQSHFCTSCAITLLERRGSERHDYGDRATKDTASG